MECSLLIIVAVLPSIGLLYYINWKDKYRKEPIGLLWKGFGYGALASALISVLVVVLTMAGIPFGKADTVWEYIYEAFIEASIPEELIKFFFLWFLLRNNQYYDEYFDGIVYAACIGLGFAALENVIYLLENYDEWVSTGILRAIVSVPGHFMFGITMGYFYAKATFGDPDHRKKNIAFAICAPILLHAAFDATLLVSQILAGALAAFYSLYIYLVEKSKRRGRDHLALDKRIMGIGKKMPKPNAQDSMKPKDKKA